MDPNNYMLIDVRNGKPGLEDIEFTNHFFPGI